MKIVFLKHRKGMILILVLSLVAALTIATTSIILVSNSDMNMESLYSDSTKSFYLAEAGIDMARTQLNVDWTDQTAINSGLGEGACSVDIFTTDAAGNPLSADQLRIRGRGAVGGTLRTVEVVVLNIVANSSAIDNAIASNGTLSIQGSATVIGPTEENAGLSFESTFGMTKAEMEAMVRGGTGIVYDEPFSNDATGVITWVNSPPGSESKITTCHWEGSGILIVMGNLKITGGEFEGVIWVEGTLKIAGNADVDGAILIAGSPSASTKITGNSDTEFDEDAIEDAFEILGSLAPGIISWHEV